MKNWRISDAWSVLRLHDKREKFRDPGFGCSISSSTSLARATTAIASGAEFQTLSEFGYAVASSIYSSWMRGMNTKTAVRPKARVLKDIYTERDSQSHQTAKGKKLSVRTVKAPGFGPKGIHRFVLPFTVFLKLQGHWSKPSFRATRRSSSTSPCLWNRVMPTPNWLEHSLRPCDRRWPGVTPRCLVDTMRREDWILDQVDRSIDVLICNPELVKTGLDLLDFPTTAFLQTGYNVYTLQQAARRSWRIGRKQSTCLQLMAKKIAVSQSTSGDVPDSGGQPGSGGQAHFGTF